MSELWSPQMRKWARDAQAHGMKLHMTSRGRRDVGFGGGSPYRTRHTNDGGFRVINGPNPQFSTQYRNVNLKT